MLSFKVPTLVGKKPEFSKLSIIIPMVNCNKPSKESMIPFQTLI